MQEAGAEIQTNAYLDLDQRGYLSALEMRGR